MHPLQNSLRLVGFLVLATLALLSAGPLVGVLSGLLALGPDRPATAWVIQALTSIALLLATWCALRTEKLGFAALGLIPTRQRLGELVDGLMAGAVLFGLVAMARAAAVGAHWEVDLAAGALTALAGLPLAFLMLLPEELIFRGYALRKLHAIWGAPAALILSSLAFGAYHLIGSDDWAIGAVFRFTMPALGGLLFGYAALRTGSLALPIGLHLGGNWIQSSVFGLGVDKGNALWSASLDATQVHALAGPDFVPHLPYLLAVTVLGVFVMRRPESQFPGAA